MPRRSIILQPCKIGTQPANVVIHGRDKVECGRTIRVREGADSKWFTVIVRSINPHTGYFQADRM